jgi:hypothetical protein
MQDEMAKQKAISFMENLLSTRMDILIVEWQREYSCGSLEDRSADQKRALNVKDFRTGDVGDTSNFHVVDRNQIRIDCGKFVVFKRFSSTNSDSP